MSARSTPPATPRRYIRMSKGEGGDALFWEVLVVGSEMYVRSGPIGTNGEAEEPREFEHFAAACVEAENRAERRRRDGYTDVPLVIGEHARHLALEAAIIDNPANDDGYLVYADWLQGQGDPRGELIILDHRADKKRHDARLLRARNRLERQHKTRLLPACIIAARNRSRSHPRVHQTQVQRKNGFLHTAHLGRHAESTPHTLRELLLALLHHPSAALLQTLEIGSLGTPRGVPDHDYQPIVQALCEFAPESLRQLVLTSHAAYSGSALGQVSELFHALPRLTRVHLCADSFHLGDIRSSAVEHVQLTSPAFNASLMRDLDNAIWPRLQHLALTSLEQDVDIDIHALPNLLSGERGGALRCLTMTRTRHTGDLLRALVASRLMSRLRSLDLSYGDLSDSDVAYITEHSDAFRSLETLMLDGNMISRHYRADVYALCPNVSLAHQRGAAADRPRYDWNDIVEFSPDSRSIMAARDVADHAKWMRLGIWGTLLWGKYQGHGLYEVFVQINSHNDMEAGCTCPSSKYPCKHALGLLMVATAQHLMSVIQPPTGLIDACRASRYDD